MYTSSITVSVSPLTTEASTTNGILTVPLLWASSLSSSPVSKGSITTVPSVLTSQALILYRYPGSRFLYVNVSVMPTPFSAAISFAPLAVLTAFVVISVL